MLNHFYFDMAHHFLITTLTLHKIKKHPSKRNVRHTLWFNCTNMNTAKYRCLEVGGLINQNMCFVFCFFTFKAEPSVSLFSIFMLSLPSLSSGFSFVFSMQTRERYQSQDSGKNANNCVSQSVEL